MRWLLVLVAGCGFRIGVGAQDGAIADDVAGDDDGSIVIDTPLPDCDAPPHWAASFTPTRTLHVDPLAVAGGTPPDGSATNPFMTISAAAAAATPGTRILLAPRSYGTVTLTDLHGSATAPIWIEGPVTAPRATFTGTNAIHLVRPQYVVLQHLDFTSLSGDAINADDGGQSMFGAAHHLAMVDIKSTSVNTTFQLTGVTDVAIYDSTLVSGSRGVQLVGVHRAVVARLAMTSLSYSSFQAAGGSRDIVLRQSRITTDGNRAVWIGGSSTENEFRPLLAAADNYEARDVRIFNNFIDGDVAAITCSSCTDALIANNRITGTLSYVVRVINEHMSALNGHAFPMPGTLRVIGNAIEVTTNPYGTRMESNTTCAACEYSHNLWLEIDNPIDSTPPLPVTETNSIYGVASGYDALGRLCAGGAAIGAGPTLPEVTGTFAGACRATPRSIGPSDAGGC